METTQIEFGKGGVPVAVVAEVYGKDACWVRAGLISGYYTNRHSNKERSADNIN